MLNKEECLKIKKLKKLEKEYKKLYKEVKEILYKKYPEHINYYDRDNIREIISKEQIPKSASYNKKYKIYTIETIYPITDLRNRYNNIYSTKQ